MYVKLLKYKWLLMAGIIFSTSVAAEGMPEPPMVLGQLIPEPDGRYCLRDTLLAGFTDRFSVCTPGDPLLPQDTLFGIDASLAIKTSVGMCLIPERRLAYTYQGHQIYYYGALPYFCGNNLDIAKYNLESKVIFSPKNGGLCLTRSLIPDGPGGGPSQRITAIFKPCDTTTPINTWVFAVDPNAPKATPALINVNGRCFNKDMNLEGSQLAQCQFGDAKQYWIYNISTQQITNGQGACLADVLSNNQVSVCNNDNNQRWEFVINTDTNAHMLKNVATQFCLNSTGSTTSACVDANNPSDLNQNWYFIAQPPVVYLIAKNDSYGAVSNPFYNQLVFDTPAAKGVRANDTPSGWPAGLTFEVVEQIKHTAGGQATAELFFRDTGGFYVMLRTNAKTASARMADKRGTYQFTYRMVMNGQYSAPATVTLNVF